MPNPMPWAVLLCRYDDDVNDPAVTTVATLAAQWRASASPEFIAANLTPAWDDDQRTILELCQQFFTITGLFTFNAVRFWDEYSHGTISTADTEVFPCRLDRSRAVAESRAISPGGLAYQTETFQLAKAALLQQHGRNWRDFPGGVAVCFQSPDHGAQGGAYDGGVGVFMDVRWVKNNGTQAWAQEMGHAFGLDHSRTDGVIDANGAPIDYTDAWDAMSTRRSWSAVDASYGMRGPGLNAWNMRGRGWLDESRVWKPPAGDFNDYVVHLRPLHKRFLTGHLAAELPGVDGDSAYLIEFRMPEEWDAGIGWPKVLVHRFEGAVGQFLGSHSYLMRGTAGQDGLGPGEVFHRGIGPFSRVKVQAIDTTTQTATIQLCHSATAPLPRSVKIVAATPHGCYPDRVAGSTIQLRVRVTQSCAGFRARWHVIGGGLVPGGASDGSAAGIVLPAGGSTAQVTAFVMFDDGVILSDTVDLEALLEAEANWQHLLCALLTERRLPEPWWQWDPARVRKALPAYSDADLQRAERRLGELQQILARLRR